MRRNYNVVRACILDPDVYHNCHHNMYTSDSLMDSAGPTGATGETGDTGPTGPTGATGLTGVSSCPHVLSHPASASLRT